MEIDDGQVDVLRQRVLSAGRNDGTNEVQRDLGLKPQLV